MPSPHLNIAHVADTAQKAPVVNEQTDLLDKALNAVVVIDVSAGGQIVLTEEQAKENVLYRLTGGPAADFSIVVPSDQRLFAVHNMTGTAKTATIEAAVTAGTWATCVFGESALFHCDGENTFKLGTSDLGSPTGLVEGFSGFIEVPEEKTYVFEQNAKYDYDIDEFTGQCLAGALDLTVEIDGTPVTGIDPGVFTTSEITATATAARRVTAGQRVTLIITDLDTDTAQDFSFTMKITRV